MIWGFSYLLVRSLIPTWLSAPCGLPACDSSEFIWDGSTVDYSFIEMMEKDI